MAKEHLKTNANENEIINKLTNIGLEVENVKENSGELSEFKIAKIIKAEKHLRRQIKGVRSKRWRKTLSSM